MELTQTHSANSNTPVQAAPSARSSVLSSDFEVFLQMLTAQAQYQDPLEPMDNSEYAAQLAQFSMVEQQVTTNDLMQELMATLGTNDMSSAANWIGMEALVTGPAKFDGDPITIAPNPPITADTVTLIAYDAQGKVVQRTAMPVSADAFEWTGLDDSGFPFPHGDYTFEVESSANGEVLMTEPAMSYARVTEARIENGQTLLVLESGYMILATNVTGLREPPV